MRRWLLILALLVGCSPQPRDDSNTVNVIPQNNASYLANLQNFLGKEDANRSAEYGFLNFVVSGCVGSTGPGLVMVPAACTAYNAGYRSTCGVGNNNGLPTSSFGNVDCAGSGAITFPNNSTCWVAMDENTTGSNPGLSNFTRVAGTHYLIDCIDLALPAMASDSQMLMEVITAGGAITGVVDLRQIGLAFGGLTANTIITKGPVQSGFGADITMNNHHVRSVHAPASTGDALSEGRDIGNVTPAAGTFTALTTNALTVNGNSLTTGTATTNSGHVLNESGAPVVTPGVSAIWNDSSGHRIKMANNGGSATNVIGASEMPLAASSSAFAPGSLNAGVCSTQPGTVVTGATTAMVCVVTPVTDPGAGIMWQGIIGAGTCAIRECNTTTAPITPTSSVFRIRVIQ